MEAIKVSIVIPVYNEQQVVREVLNQVKEVVRDIKNIVEIIVVNDGSFDNTGGILNSIQGIKVINNPYNMGYGASLKKGIRAAKGTHILITDSDGTYDVKDIPKLLKYVNDFDMVVGARTGKNVGIPFFRKPAKFFLGILANFLTGKKIPDLNSGLRVFNKELALRFFNILPKKFSFTATITLAAMTNDYSVKYIPINYHKRKGKSSIQPFDFVNFTSLIIRVIMYFKPLRFFLVPCILLFLIGVANAIRTIILHNNISDVSVTLILVAIQVGFLGLVADLIVRSRK